MKTLRKILAFPLYVVGTPLAVSGMIVLLLAARIAGNEPEPPYYWHD